jgi:hypothetical protein
MRTHIVATAVALAVASFSAQAGQFHVWSYDTGKGQTHVEVSFAGDGVTQDAQIDLAMPAGYKLVSAKNLVEGSVCVASEEAKLIRAVPPSGAGKALASNDTNYCRFVFARGPSVKGKLTFEPKLTECAGSGAAECQVEFQDVSEKAGRGVSASGQ